MWVFTTITSKLNVCKIYDCGEWFLRDSLVVKHVVWSGKNVLSRLFIFVCYLFYALRFKFRLAEKMMVNIMVLRVAIYFLNFLDFLDLTRRTHDRS